MWMARARDYLFVLLFVLTAKKQVMSSVLVPEIIPCIKGHILRGSQDAVGLQKAYLYL